MELGVPQLRHGDGKLSDPGNEHHYCGFVLLANRRREREQPGGGPQPCPRPE